MSPPSPPDSAAPTKVRYRVVAVCTLMALVLYLDRFCFAFAEVFIKEDLGLTDSQISYMLAGFSLTYAICQVPSGWLSDRFGSRLMLTSYIVVWSLFTGLAGAAIGIVTLVLFRFGMGIGQAGAYPTSAKIVSEWMPLNARGSASGIISAGGRMGAVIAPLLTAYLMVLLVPVGNSSEIEVGDVMNLTSMAQVMADPAHADSQFLVTFREHLSTPSRELLDESGARITAIKEEADDDQEASAAILRLPPATAEQRQQMTDDLNGMLEVELYDKKSFEFVALTRQTRNLAARPFEELTSDERSRLNRLLIEAQFPGAIRKLYGRAWRPLMVIYGLAGIAVALAFWVIVRDDPRRHPRCNAGELAVIEQGMIPASERSTRPIGGAPLKELITNIPMWMNCMMQFATNVGWIFLVSWLPRYLDQRHHIPLTQRGLMTSIPILVGWLGMLWGGLLTDQLVSRIGLRWGRVLPISLSRFLAMAAYAACLLDPSPWMAVIYLSIVAFGTDLGNPAIWAFSQDVGGRHVGSVLGWGNMFGNFGAVIGPILLIEVVGDTYEWNNAFLVCSGAFLVSGLAALGIDPTRPIVREDVSSPDAEAIPFLDSESSS